MKRELALWRVGILPGLTMIGLVVLLRLTGFLQFQEWQALDSFLRLRPAEPVDERVVIVGMSEADLARVGYPVPDRELAALLRTLQQDQPRAIGLDLARDRAQAELVVALKENPTQIAVEKVLPDRIAPPPGLPLEQVGFVDAITDGDSRLRRSLLGTPTQVEPDYKFSLVVRLAQAYLSAEGIPLENGRRDPETMRFGDVELPRFFSNSGGYVGADAGGVQVLLNYRSGRQSFRRLSLHDIKIGNFEPSWIRDRIVLIGMTAISAKDIFNTSAIAAANPAPGQMYGVEIQAHAVSQILSAVLDGRSLMSTWSDGWEYLWIVGWGIVGIVIAGLPLSPVKNLLGVALVTLGLVLISYGGLAGWGWWVPVFPAAVVLVLNGIVLTSFYYSDRALRSRLRDRQQTIDRTFDTIHNGPLQTLKLTIKEVRDRPVSSAQLLVGLENLNGELRAVYESLRRETLTQKNYLHLGNGTELDLQASVPELLYQVYSQTLERDFPCFTTLRVKMPSFAAIDEQRLGIEQKRGLGQFLEEALCNVGQYATGVTRLQVTCTQSEGWCVLRVEDNGVGLSASSEGRGTQQAKNLARQLGGKFERQPRSPKGTVCQLTWPVKKTWLARWRRSHNQLPVSIRERT
ncbi:MAG: CHASE2 domain-containing protein [Cyanophyceae cyanobacterium]